MSSVIHALHKKIPLVGFVVSNGQFDLLAFGEVEKSRILAYIDDFFLGRANQLDGRLHALELHQGWVCHERQK